MDACKRPAVIAGRRLLALLLVIAFGGCTRLSTASPDPSGSGRPEHPWTEPGVVRMAVSTSPNTLDPLLTTQQIESALTALVFDPLVATGPDGNDVPVLASRVPTLENGDIARDGRTITYHLRHGVKWHDGAPFTSRDVRFTWQAIMNPNTAITTRHGYDLIEHVDIPDPYTAVFRLKEPFAPAVHTFFSRAITTSIGFRSTTIPWARVRSRSYVGRAATGWNSPRTTRMRSGSRSCGASSCA